MNLVISDLPQNVWEQISNEYPECRIVTDDGTIKPCLGCFCCWTKSPGLCVIKDNYAQIAKWMGEAAEITVISRYTYGGCSGFVKNVLDRSVGCILPYFEVYKGELHHKKRYPDEKQITFRFWGADFTDVDKAAARKYTEAICTNMRTTLKDIVFDSFPFEQHITKTASEPKANGGILLLSCSMRASCSNSKTLLDKLSENIHQPFECLELKAYRNNLNELTDKINAASRLVLSIPMYIDALPSHVVRLFEHLEMHGDADQKRVYAISNMGLYESCQLCNLMAMIRRWCEKTGYQYSGGLAVGAGEMIGRIINRMPLEKGIIKHVGKGMLKLAKAIENSEVIEDIYADPAMFPRFLYKMMANMEWPKAARQNGLNPKELLRCP